MQGGEERRARRIVRYSAARSDEANAVIAFLDETWLDNQTTQGDRGEVGGGMDAKNVVQVQIFGHSYTIRGEADQDYITSVAAYVDRKMREITEKLPVASLSKVAILASLNIADELFKERARRETEERDLRDFSTRTARLTAVLDEVIQGATSS